jgi:hypothetical protein
MTEGAADEEAAEAGGKGESMAEDGALDDMTQRRQLGAQFRDLFHGDAPVVEFSGCVRSVATVT